MVAKEAIDKTFVGKPQIKQEGADSLLKTFFRVYT